LIRKDNEEDSEEEVDLDSAKIEKELIYECWLKFRPHTWRSFLEDAQIS